MKKFNSLVLLSLLLITQALLGLDAAAGRSLLNASYDPARELYQAFNKQFIAYWRAETGETVTIRRTVAPESRPMQWW